MDTSRGREEWLRKQLKTVHQDIELARDKGAFTALSALHRTHMTLREQIDELRAARRATSKQTDFTSDPVAFERWCEQLDDGLLQLAVAVYCERNDARVVHELREVK